MPTTLRSIIENLPNDYLTWENGKERIVTVEEQVDTALTAIQKWAEGKVPANPFLNWDEAEYRYFQQAIDETLANIRREGVSEPTKVLA